LSAPTISVVVTTYNEGHELDYTVRSVVANTSHLAEVIIVDDGSDDGSCERLPNNQVQVIRHSHRIGVAFSRHEGSRAARGDVLCYLDAHQRVSNGCLDRCAQLAWERQAITCPDIRGYGLFAGRLRGADFRLCSERGYFSGEWRQRRQLPGVSVVSGLRSPPYLIPRSIYADVSWSPSLRGWGASEASMAVKSFFMGIEILQISGPVARHRFQRRFRYQTGWDEVWRNQGIIARTCFDDATWFHYWLPKVFAPHLTDEARATIEGSQVQAEHEHFLSRKRRTDRQFWTDLLRLPTPPGI
jgi:glycosyltransferase involved in cell wall biosynthesis